jgi:predicted small lipoprotein YifL
VLGSLCLGGAGTGERDLAFRQDLASNRLSLGSALVLALVLPLALAACGRKGPLDPPPSAELPPAPAAAPASSVAPGPRTYVDPLTPIGTAQQQAPPVVATQALPAPTQPANKTFILDPLIR